MNTLKHLNVKHLYVNKSVSLLDTTLLSPYKVVQSFVSRITQRLPAPGRDVIGTWVFYFIDDTC